MKRQLLSFWHANNAIIKPSVSPRSFVACEISLLLALAALALAVYGIGLATNSMKKGLLLSGNFNIFIITKYID